MKGARSGGPPPGRDRRMLASLRANLGAPTLVRVPPKGPSPRSRFQDLEEALLSLEEALDQPSTSLRDFELFLRQNNRNFSPDDCEKIASVVKTYCMESGEYRFITRVACDNIGCLDLATAIAKEFLVLANEYMNDADVAKQAVPELLGNVLAWKWPPGKSKAIESVNPILYVALNVLISWVNVMMVYSGESHSESKENARESDLESEPEFDSDMAELASMAVFTVCNVSQRNLWLNFMETFDQIFVATKALLVSSASLPKVCRECLLNLYMCLFKWSGSGQSKCATTSTQTS